MLLDALAAARVPVASVGKIFDVFLGRGIEQAYAAKTNPDAMEKILEAMRETDRGLIWVNLVDFDMLFGHRNDVEGYARALEQFDAWIPEFQSRLGADDLVIFTADHGCDPTTPSTDHSREYVPLLVTGPRAWRGADLGTRASLADIGRTVAEDFGTKILKGTSFLPQLL